MSTAPRSTSNNMAPSAAGSGKRFVQAVIAVLLTALACVYLAFPDNAREYWLYLTEDDRPSLALRYDEISQDWSEADIKKRFVQLRLRCYDNRPGEYLDDRSCFADLGDHNGSPAMGIAFHLAEGKVNHVGVSVPWWAHGKQAAALLSAYGRPFAVQHVPIEGFRLAGWKMPGGHAIFFNRDRPINPVMWNEVLWSSDRSCRAKGCFESAAWVRKETP